MNCDMSRSWFSALIDREAPDGVRRELRDHLARCECCTEELRDLRATRRSLKETPRDELPAGLTERIVRSLEAIDHLDDTDPSRPAPPLVPPAVAPAQSTARGGVTPGGTADAPPRRGRSRVAVGLVALLLITAAFWAGRESSPGGSISGQAGDPGSARDALDGARDRAERLSGQVRALERDLEARTAALRDELSSARSEAERALAASIEETRAERERRETAESRTTFLESEIDEVRSREQRLSRELAEARGEIRDMVSDPRLIARAGGGAEGAARLTPDSPAQVEFERTGDQLHLTTSGPLTEIVPKLLDEARRSDDPARADAALAALESFLADEIAVLEHTREDGASDDEDGARGRGLWASLQHGIRGVATETGISSDEPTEPRTAEERREATRLRRLRSVERAWSRSTTEPRALVLDARRP